MFSTKRSKLRQKPVAGTPHRAKHVNAHKWQKLKKQTKVNTQSPLHLHQEVHIPPFQSQSHLNNSIQAHGSAGSGDGARVSLHQHTQSLFPSTLQPNPHPHSPHIDYLQKRSVLGVGGGNREKTPADWVKNIFTPQDFVQSGSSLDFDIALDLYKYGVDIKGESGVGVGVEGPETQDRPFPLPNASTNTPNMLMVDAEDHQHGLGFPKASGVDLNVKTGLYRATSQTLNTIIDLHQHGPYNLDLTRDFNHYDSWDLSRNDEKLEVGADGKGNGAGQTSPSTSPQTQTQTNVKTDQLGDQNGQGDSNLAQTLLSALSQLEKETPSPSNTAQHSAPNSAKSQISANLLPTASQVSSSSPMQQSNKLVVGHGQQTKQHGVPQAAQAQPRQNQQKPHQNLNRNQTQPTTTPIVDWDYDFYANNSPMYLTTLISTDHQQNNANKLRFHAQNVLQNDPHNDQQGQNSSQNDLQTMLSSFDPYLIHSLQLPHLLAPHDDPSTTNLTPPEIVSHLNRFIIGQNDAKRVVATSLRNRYRTLKLPPSQRQHILPKNILLKGPTGSGKTQIAKILAKMTNSPLIHANMTQFTETGFVGKSVDSIINDLIQASIRVVIDGQGEQLARESRENADWALSVRMPMDYNDLNWLVSKISNHQKLIQPALIVDDNDHNEQKLKNIPNQSIHELVENFNFNLLPNSIVSLDQQRKLTSSVELPSFVTNSHKPHVQHPTQNDQNDENDQNQQFATQALGSSSSSLSQSYLASLQHVSSHGGSSQHIHNLNENDLGQHGQNVPPNHQNFQNGQNHYDHSSLNPVLSSNPISNNTNSLTHNKARYYHLSQNDYDNNLNTQTRHHISSLSSYHPSHLSNQQQQPTSILKNPNKHQNKSNQTHQKIEDLFTLLQLPISAQSHHSESVDNSHHKNNINPKYNDEQHQNHQHHHPDLNNFLNSFHYFPSPSTSPTSPPIPTNPSQLLQHRLDKMSQSSPNPLPHELGNNLISTPVLNSLLHLHIPNSPHHVHLLKYIQGELGNSGDGGLETPQITLEEARQNVFVSWNKYFTSKGVWDDHLIELTLPLYALSHDAQKLLSQIDVSDPLGDFVGKTQVDHNETILKAQSSQNASNHHTSPLNTPNPIQNTSINPSPPVNTLQSKSFKTTIKNARELFSLMEFERLSLQTPKYANTSPLSNSGGGGGWGKFNSNPKSSSLSNLSPFSPHYSPPSHPNPPVPSQNPFSFTIHHSSLPSFSKTPSPPQNASKNSPSKTKNSHQISHISHPSNTSLYKHPPSTLSPPLTSTQFNSFSSSTNNHSFGHTNPFASKDRENGANGNQNYPLHIIAEAIELAQKSGIVILDEIDKLITAPNIRSSSSGGGGEASAEGVAKDLLPIMGGCVLQTTYGAFDTSNLLFIAAGAFSDVSPANMLPELAGRLPLQVELKALGIVDYWAILQQTENSLLRQSVQLLAQDGIGLRFTADSVWAMAELAHVMNRTGQNTGARRLNQIVDTILEDANFYLSNTTANGALLVIDGDYVRNKGSVMMKGVGDNHGNFLL